MITRLWSSSTVSSLTSMRRPGSKPATFRCTDDDTGMRTPPPVVGIPRYAAPEGPGRVLAPTASTGADP